MGIIIPKAVSHAPRPLIPFFPFRINSPVIASKIKAPEKISEKYFHHIPGL